MASRNSRNEHCRGRETRERAPVTQPRMRPPNWLTVRAFRVARACPGRRRTDPRACPADAGSVPRPRGAHLINDEDTPYRELCRMRWAALIKRVYEVDPLHCPDCGAKMKIIAFIERRDQPDVVEKILRHCGSWDRPASRARRHVKSPSSSTWNSSTWTLTSSSWPSELIRRRAWVSSPHNARFGLHLSAECPGQMAFGSRAAALKVCREIRFA